MTSRALFPSLVVLLALLSGCAKTESPAAPLGGNLPSLGLTCPDLVTTQSFTGAPVVATYDEPIQDPPIEAGVSCSPGSGSAFPVGTNIVTCATTDTKQTPTCEFKVFVKAPPTLTRTRFVAFGDSITDGFVRLLPDLFGPAGDPIGYPFRLQRLLDRRYLPQATLVINRGLGGETASEGANRLPRILNQDRPEVLLLLEGLNQLQNTSVSAVANDLRRMVRAGRGSGATVLIATLTPVSLTLNAERPGLRNRIIELNAQIFNLARQENIGEPVDLYTAFGDDRDLLGSDGEHPTLEGYQVIAETFFERISQDLEVIQTPTVTATPASVAGR